MSAQIMKRICIPFKGGAIGTSLVTLKNKENWSEKFLNYIEELKILTFLLANQPLEER